MPDLKTRFSIAAGVLAVALALAGGGCKDKNDTGTSTTASASTGGPTGSSGGTGGGDSASGRPAVKNSVAIDTSKPVIIGLVASLSGDQKPWGEDSNNGAQLAVKEFNDAGGLNGQQVKLEVQDSQSTQQAAKTAADKLISEGAVALVGEVSSGNTEQMAREAYEKGIPDVAIGATKTTLTGIGNNVFRVCYTDAFQGPVMARFAFQERGIKTVAIMTDKKQPYSQGLSASFKTEYEKLGGKVVDEESYETGQSTFTTQLTNLKEKNPEGIFMSGYFPEVGPIASAARQQGIKAEFFGGDGWDSPQILQSGGQAIIGSFFCNHYNNKEDRPIVKEFLDKWQKAYGGVPGTTMGALGYDAMKITLESLKKAADAKKSGLTSLDLIAAIDSVENFHGVSGDISLKGHNGDPPKRALVVEIRPASEGFQVFRKAYEYFTD